MLRRVAAVTLVLGLAGPLPAAAQSISKDTANAPAGAYTLDPGHSQMLFAIAHIGLTDYYGRFDRLSGTLNFDPRTPEKSSVAVTIDTTSVDTPSGGVNDELKGAVFGIRAFPSAAFKSTAVTRTGPDTGRIAGDLTIKGVTKPVTLDVVFSGGEEDPLNGDYALGFKATATIKRTDFGLTGMEWEPLVGDDVKLIIEAMFERQKD
ncbi:MAG: YceI family protein [Rhizomicrobium sp.]|jgi:polyisoprenoid-binding protein YceI